MTEELCQQQIAELTHQVAATISEPIVNAVAQSKIINWKRKLETIQLVGPYTEEPFSIISLQTARETNYDLYIQVQNELAAAVRELRDEASLNYFHKEFDDLEEREQIMAIRQLVPQRISEAIPYKQ